MLESLDPRLALLLVAALCGIVILLFLRRRKTRVHTPPNANNSPSSSNDDTRLSGSLAIELACINGPLMGQRFPMKRGWIAIGREPGNDVVLDSSLVSRRHAVIVAENAGVMLYDLDSTNGTWTNGQRVDRIALFERQVFQIGPAALMLVGAGQAISSYPKGSGALPQGGMPLAPADLNAPTLGSYRPMTLLGSGGAATVFRYTDSATGQNIAVKFLHHSADPYFRQKFQAEGDVGLTLQHPHIVQTLGVGLAGGWQYIVMEYLPGGSLRDVLLSRRPSTEASVQIAGQMCSALQYAHDRGVFHRDMKPENILFTGNGVAKLADFGIARFAGLRTVTREGMLIGTPEYMSYEQAKGTEIDGRSDQYSLAIVLYEMLSGVRPFDGHALSVVEQHLRKEPESPRVLNPAIPPSLEKVIMRALSKDKSKRFPTVKAMAEAIGYEPAIGSEAPVITPVSRGKEPSAPARLVSVQSGQVISVTQLVTVIGRDHQLSHELVSRQHAQIITDDYGYVIVDLDSLNGTYVNGVRVTGPTRLQSGTFVNFGPLQFQFLDGREVN